MDTRDYAIHYASAVGKALNVTVAPGIADDDYLIELDGWVYVRAEEIEVCHPSLLAITSEVIKVPGFVVSQVVVTPATYWEPEDADVVDVSEHRVLTDAIREAFLLVMANTIDRVIQSEAENMYADEIASATTGRESAN